MISAMKTDEDLANAGSWIEIERRHGADVLGFMRRYGQPQLIPCAFDGLRESGPFHGGRMVLPVLYRIAETIVRRECQ